MISKYITLTKPGIIMGNLITAAGGFLFASRGSVDLWLLWATLVGIALVIASGCVANNYLDRRIDAHMARTKQRALVQGSIPVVAALTYSVVLGVLGFGLLILYTNPITVMVGVFGLFMYLVMYSIWKRRSTIGTVVGSFSGATPIAAGYLAVTGHIDTAAIILFIILILWQMPHFYAIAMYRHSEYAAASLPVLPVVKGAQLTKTYIAVYICAFLTACFSLALLNYAGIVYLVAMTILGFLWLRLALQGFKAPNDNAWARSIFKVSLRTLTLFSILIALDSFLP